MAEAIPDASRAAIDQCLAAAEANLRNLSGVCRTHVEGQLALLDGNLEHWPASPDPAILQNVYLASLSIVGAAGVANLPHVRQAAHGLCELIDNLRSANAWTREPLRVHVLGMRLLLDPSCREEDARSILDGLSQVRAKYPAAPM